MIRVDEAVCETCGACVGVCPADALSMEGNRLAVDETACIGCEACVEVCPVGALSSGGETI